MEQSAALESTNIVCCAYLNALIRALPAVEERVGDLVPQPPTLRREFAGSLIESTLLDQAIAEDDVFLVRTSFEVDGGAMNWKLLFIPASDSVATLQELL
jgi:chemotaxis protein CheC